MTKYLINFLTITIACGWWNLCKNVKLVMDKHYNPFENTNEINELSEVYLVNKLKKVITLI